MSQPRTQSRALELVVWDMDPKGKPPDTDIASNWGLADARSVREIRESAEYKHLLLELQSQAVSHMGDRVMEIQQDAIDSLAGLVPRLAESAVRMLTPPDDIPHPENWVPKYTDVSAANAVASTLIKLSGLNKLESKEKSVKTGGQVLPDLRPAKSDSSLIREQYSIVVERLTKEGPSEDPDIVEGDYEFLQAIDTET